MCGRNCWQVSRCYGKSLAVFHNRAVYKMTLTFSILLVGRELEWIISLPSSGMVEKNSLTISQSVRLAISNCTVSLFLQCFVFAATMSGTSRSDPKDQTFCDKENALETGLMLDAEPAVQLPHKLIRTNAQ